RKEANFVLRKLAKGFLRLAVARCFGVGEKVRQRNVHGFSDFGERFERRHGMAVFDAREVAAQQACAALDVALRQSALAAIGLDNFSDVHPWFFFWHGRSCRGGILVTNSRSGKRKSRGTGSKVTTGTGQARLVGIPSEARDLLFKNVK